jgi:hypothetical protein
MIELQKAIFDVWWKVLILIDVPFKTIEKTMSEFSGSLEEKINGVQFNYFSMHSLHVLKLLDFLCNECVPKDNKKKYVKIEYSIILR